MNTLTVWRGKEERFELVFHAPEMLASVLKSAGIEMNKPCGGRGTCGKCKAEIKGLVSEPNERERFFNSRLVCQAMLLGDAEVRLPESTSLEQIELGGIGKAEVNDAMQGKLGAAVDIGTTTLAVRVYDLTDGTVVGEVGSENPQRTFAADVMGRISAALAGNAEELRRKITVAIEKLLESILSQSGRSGETIDSLVITGNTTMLYLLTGQDVTCLSRAPFEADRLFDEEIPFHKGNAYLPPCVSAFVGADISCAVLSSGMCRTGETNMLCDIGTNGEIVLWKDGKIYVTSTAPGPAFEGAGISCGCGSVRGAIDKIEVENGSIRIHTIGDTNPVGLCGSGLLDALASFLELGVIDETGAADEESLAVNPEVKLTRADIRAVQLAKAAIATGIETLMRVSKTGVEQVSKLYIAGGFGRHINVSSAVSIGLIPRELGDKVHYIGNGALAGAEKLLLGRGRRTEIQKIVKEAVPINLASDPDFNERFVNHLYFNN